MTERSDWFGSPGTRQSVTEKGALGRDALAFGVIAGSDASTTVQANRAAVPLFRFYPETDFEVVSRLEAGTTVDMLWTEEETVAELSRPDEWTGHVIRYNTGGDGGIMTLLYTRNQRLRAGDSGTIGTDASVLSADLGLLRVSLEETHTLTVSVEDGDEDPIEGVAVTVSDGTDDEDDDDDENDLEVIDEGETDEDGVVEFTDLEDGEYTVHAEADGYEEADEDVEIDGDDEAVTLILEEENEVDDDEADDEEAEVDDEEAEEDDEEGFIDRIVNWLTGNGGNESDDNGGDD